jgi:hypothetical protein
MSGYHNTVGVDDQLRFSAFIDGNQTVWEVAVKDGSVIGFNKLVPIYQLDFNNVNSM